MAREAAATYGVFATDDAHPVEFDAGQQAQLAGWVAQRLGRAVAPPDLSQSGYRFMGGRVVATDAGAACMFLYGDGHGGRVSLFVRPMHGRDEEAAMRPVEAGEAAGYAWAQGGLGFGLVSSRTAPSLRAISNRIRDSMAPRT